MKYLNLLLIIIVMLFGFTFIRKQNNQLAIDTAARQKAIQKKALYAIRCAPGLTLFNPEDSANTIPLLGGWGDYRMPVTTRSDSANIYFQQGINMYYGFHVIEALASFAKAVHFDTGFAMGYWGMALSYGPNINDFGYSASPEALLAMRRAKALNSHCTNMEKGLIDAMQVRYTEDTAQSREALNQLYADAMKKMYALFPSNADAGALYVDALMVQHPWDLYYKNYSPKTWTAPIVTTLETILKAAPNHPGACHYYIHAVEASAHPERGVKVSERLAYLQPGLAHVVHMPSHIFIRSGYYRQGEQTNERAVTGYYDYLAKYPAVANSAIFYLVHNLHMQASCANMDGTYKTAMKSSMDCRNSFDDAYLSLPGYAGVFFQYVYMTPYLTQIRFGKWDDILQAPQPASGFVYANLLWHYGQGLGHARKGELAEANKHLDSLQAGLSNQQLSAPAPSYANPGIAASLVAEKILQGVIAEEQNNLPASLSFLRGAVSAEDSMIYNEPRDWVHPARQYLGAVLLKAKQYAKAEGVYKEDLFINPHNGWSLTGLAIAYEKEKKMKEANTTKAAAKKAFEGSDVVVMKSVF